MAKLDIIVPVYKRGKEIIPTVQSLSLQTQKDFAVYFVFDGEEAKDEVSAIQNVCSISALPAFHIVGMKHGGVGAARNHGISASSSPYIMFLDSDDLLLPNAVGTIMNAIEHGFDMMVGKTMREAANGNFEVVGGEQMTWIHGRVYSRQFLNDYGISFPILPMCEDLAFNMLCAEFAETVPQTQWPIHIQRYTPGSLSRSDGSLHLQAETYIEACIFYVERAKRSRSPYELKLLPSALAACYYYLDSVSREFPHDHKLYSKMCEQFIRLVDVSCLSELNTLPEWENRFAMALATPARPFNKIYAPELTFEQRVANARRKVSNGTSA